MSSVLWLIPALPLLGSVVIAVLGRRLLKSENHWPCVLGIGLYGLTYLYPVYLGEIRGSSEFAQTRYRLWQAVHAPAATQH